MKSDSEEEDANGTVSETDTADEASFTECQSKQRPVLGSLNEAQGNHVNDSYCSSVGTICEGMTNSADDLKTLCDMLRKCDLNWFYFIKNLKQISNISDSRILDFSDQLSCSFTEQEMKIIDQSRQAFTSAVIYISRFIPMTLLI